MGLDRRERTERDGEGKVNRTSFLENTDLPRARFTHAPPRKQDGLKKRILK